MSGLRNLLLPFSSAVTNCLHSRCGLATSVDVSRNFARSDRALLLCILGDSALLTLVTATQTPSSACIVLFLWLNSDICELWQSETVSVFQSLTLAVDFQSPYHFTL